jgi:site-specific recombinase XerD
MLEDYFLKPKTLDRIRQSWIAESIEKYVTWMEVQGHASQTIHHHVPLLVSFGEYAKERGARSLSDLPAHVPDFACHREKQWLVNRTDIARKKIIRDVGSTIDQMLAVVLPEFRGRSRIRRTEVPRFDFTEQFFAFLRNERGLSTSSMRVYDYSLGLFQSYLDRIGLERVNQLSPVILSGFVIDVKDRLGKASLTRVLSPLRIMLRFLFRERLIARDLSSSLEAPRTYELANLPRSISWDEVRIMLESVELRSAVGRRDYAILLLLVTYGLRAREVAAITIDDIDWKNERLRIRERKAGHSTAYPLSSVVGNAILEYMKKDRPKSAERALFFRMHAPISPLTWQSISGRAVHYLRLAGIDVPKRGSHTLRHTCVQRLVDARFSFKQIGDYIGHGSPDSTRIYTKVDIESLRELSLGLGEDLI